MREVVARTGKIRIDLQRPLELGDGFIGVAALRQRDRQVVMRARGMRIERRCRAVLRRSIVEPPRFQQHVAEVVEASA